MHGHWQIDDDGFIDATPTFDVGCLYYICPAASSGACLISCVMELRNVPFSI